jgi:hypothetical protein
MLTDEMEAPFISQLFVQMTSLWNLEVYGSDKALDADRCSGLKPEGATSRRGNGYAAVCFQSFGKTIWRNKEREFTRLRRLFLMQLFQDFPGGIGARTTSQSSSRMGARAAKIQIRYRSRVPSPVEQRPHSEKLIER